MNPLIAARDAHEAACRRLQRAKERKDTQAIAKHTAEAQVTLHARMQAEREHVPEFEGVPV